MERDYVIVEQQTDTYYCHGLQAVGCYLYGSNMYIIIECSGEETLFVLSFFSHSPPTLSVKRQVGKKRGVEDS